MTKVLTVFIDGLKPESLEYMGFLNTLNKKRIKTDLGYSNTCHASMHTGVYPSKHRSWFIWKYSPETSPFKILNKIGKVGFLNNIYFKCFNYKLLLQLLKGATLGGLPYLAMQKMFKWGYFDGEMVNCYNEPNNFIGKYPTIFKILRDNSIKVTFKYCNISNLADSLKIKLKNNTKAANQLDYLFIGEIDELSHKYGQDSQKTIEELIAIDKMLENKYKELERGCNDFFFILFSDHGHIKVKNVVDLYYFFKSEGKNLENYIYFIDTNYARFWFRNDKEKEEIEEILLKMEDKGFILTDELLKKYHVNMPNNKYGDMIFYLDKPNTFSYDRIHLLGKDRSSSVVSVHGLLPDYPDSDGVFVSNKRIADKKSPDEFHIILQDIPPSILNLFGVGIPEYMDGEIIWKK